MHLNLTVTSKSFTVLELKWRKSCHPEIEEGKLQPWTKPLSEEPIYDPVHAALSTAVSTHVFYVSVGICCPVIFLVVLVLAVLHLHSVKRIELGDSISTSSSSQGLSQSQSFPDVSVCERQHTQQYNSHLQLSNLVARGVRLEKCCSFGGQSLGEWYQNIYPGRGTQKIYSKKVPFGVPPMGFM